MLLYNPSQLPREDLERLFVVRKAELNEMLSRVRAVGDSPQHTILIGDRGMGKTTLLNRLAHRIEADPDLAHWLPVCLDEEQYSLGGLADLWLSCLDIAAENAADADILRYVDELRKQHTGEKLEEEAFKELERLASSKQRRLLLLVDNFDLVLGRLQDIEERRLREVLISQDRPWLVLIGASSTPIDSAFNYESPFYELFKLNELRPLSREETLDLLKGLAKVYGAEASVNRFLERESATFETIHTLIDGSPRSATALFTALRSLPEVNLSKLITYLLDYHTSDYKDRIEALPTQGQRVFDVLAQKWNPATAEEVSKALRIDRGAASAQLHRLVDRRMVIKVKLADNPMRFLVRQRLFNLWCLMRGERRNRHKLRNLLEFLEILHSRRREHVKDFRRLVTILRYLEALDPDVNRRFLNVTRELEVEQKQQVIPATRSQIDNMALLLANLSLGRYQQAELLAEHLLKLEPGSDFARLTRAFSLQRLDRLDDALELLSASQTSDWMRIEYARLLLIRDRNSEARRVVLQLTEKNDLPAEQLAQASIDLVNATDGDTIAWLVQDLLSQAESASPDSLSVLMAQCRVELCLKRVDKAGNILRSVLRRFCADSSSHAGFDILELLLGLVRVERPSRMLQLLDDGGFANRWFPLTFALQHLESPDGGVLESLAPELKTFTQEVLVRINKL